MTAISDTGKHTPTFDYQKRGRWIDTWEPDDPEFWASGGARTARKNLAFSVFAENLGFSVWVIWGSVVTSMGAAGFGFLSGLGQGDPTAVSNALLLTSTPTLVGAALRIPYTFAIPRFGGRAFTAFSAAMLLIPTLGLAYFVNQPNTPMWVFLVLAALAGVGGGNFSSSMANISFFFPEGKKGAALGINAAGGNLGVAQTQLILPLLITFGTHLTAKDPAGYRFGITLAVLVWVPFILIATVGALRCMDSLRTAKSDGKSYRLALTNQHTWVMSVLYIGTFGSFIGFSFAFPTLIKANFPDLAKIGWITTLGNLAFLGALVGSFSRPFGGWVSDKIGGAKITLTVFAGMAVAVALIMAALELKSFPLYLMSFLLLFVLTGIGNGSTYRMIPSIFSAEAAKYAAAHDLDPGEAAASAKRQAGAAIGVIGAIGASGGYLLQQALRLSNINFGSMAPAFWGYAVAFVVMAGVTWWFYLRSAFAVARVPSLAYANV
ncbi:NarK/NasA family nitrate transporter [Nocardia cyriacigeorgica]|uniref:NarK/NasA family nitrate transporter n=1 Tax=Nocardia cyriacigeorgica TaxID=135487 RepID=A0A6P1DEU6_9NOCA|nr:nitrate/nitrite transporter [Nocardia cyriacigeorgica]NEW41075.1 NarK/NasA family nitrate transporter [Nocardia cyriacigeorgica]NEW46942.1 NarK/NasA family nitrate transporter [Nocardia cyriacigeorgica]NEW52960.1 NarK/NasA family nitrate transporter [Nocardia cyriacigeorgica]NEW55193.1 NarK/NasA family nitrate transporter [Nocardia cyriacigeorgica]